jgi:hypothetical protein
LRKDANFDAGGPFVIRNQLFDRLKAAHADAGIDLQLGADVGARTRETTKI